MARETIILSTGEWKSCMKKISLSGFLVNEWSKIKLSTFWFQTITTFLDQRRFEPVPTTPKVLKQPPFLALSELHTA